MQIVSRYEPRTWFMPFHLRSARWAILVAHRRAGKTVAAINDTIERASRNPRENPRYAYIGPLLRQAKDIAWTYLKEYAAPYRPKINESELRVELSALPNSPRISIYGADNPDSFRGMYFDGAILDEYGDMSPIVFREVLLPALTDRRGWCVFMGTPKGPNHFREMWYKRIKDSSWFHDMVPVTQTKCIREEDLEDMRDIMDPEQYAQEMLCSFEASVRGAIYARQVEIMLAENRVGEFPLIRTHEVDVVMDLGFRDLCAMGFIQERPDGIVMGHSHADMLKPIQFYIDYIAQYLHRNKLKLGSVHLPHDAKAKSLQTGKAIIDHFRVADLRPKLVPELGLLDGIAATRMMFPHWYIHEVENEDLILALKSYHRKYDDKTKVYMDEPVHDWSSHWSDMFRYASIVKKPADVTKYVRETAGLVKKVARPIHYGFSLNELHEANQREPRRRV